jgi:hypothetical protein
LFLAVSFSKASTISAVELAGTTPVTVDSNPVVTSILCQPGTFNGKSYTSYSFLINDGTGSAMVYGTLSGLGYTPTVGDAITVSSPYAPYHQIPELSLPTAVSLVSSGNAVSAPAVETIAQLNQTTLPENIAGYLFTVDNVTLSGLTTFGIANQTGSMSDGTNSMTFYYWPTSYSAANVNLFGQTPPTGLVDVTGFVSVYPSSPAEFAPISITAVPEPASMGLLLIGGIAALIRRRSAKA